MMFPFAVIAKYAIATKQVSKTYILVAVGIPEVLLLNFFMMTRTDDVISGIINIIRYAIIFTSPPLYSTAFKKSSKNKKYLTYYGFKKSLYFFVFLCFCVFFCFCIDIFKKILYNKCTI